MLGLAMLVFILYLSYRVLVLIRHLKLPLPGCQLQALQINSLIVSAAPFPLFYLAHTSPCPYRTLLLIFREESSAAVVVFKGFLHLQCSEVFVLLGVTHACFLFDYQGSSVCTVKPIPC